MFADYRFFGRYGAFEIGNKRYQSIAWPNFVQVGHWKHAPVRYQSNVNRFFLNFIRYPIQKACGDFWEGNVLINRFVSNIRSPKGTTSGCSASFELWSAKIDWAVCPVYETKKQKVIVNVLTAYISFTCRAAHSRWIITNLGTFDDFANNIKVLDRSVTVGI